MGLAEKLALAMDLLKRTEKCVCPGCGHEHTVERGVIGPEDVRKILDCEPCNHRWTGRRFTGSPSEPDEYVEFCEECGAEKIDE